MTINPQKGKIWQVNLDPTIGQEIKKIRPVVVISSIIQNVFEVNSLFNVIS